MNTVKAICVVEIKIDCDSVWSVETTVEQVMKQAEKDALDRIRKLFHDATANDSQLVTKRRPSSELQLVGVTQIETRISKQ